MFPVLNFFWQIYCFSLQLHLTVFENSSYSKLFINCLTINEFYSTISSPEDSGLEVRPGSFRLVRSVMQCFYIPCNYCSEQITKLTNRVKRGVNKTFENLHMLKIQCVKFITLFNHHLHFDRIICINFRRNFLSRTW